MNQINIPINYLYQFFNKKMLVYSMIFSSNCFAVIIVLDEKLNL